MALFIGTGSITWTSSPIQRTADGDALPRVRTWIREYVSSSDLLLNDLQLTALDELAPDWYGQAYGGYLEMMYAGVGSEILYRPYGAKWALGADINAVRQRDWNNTLKLADYSTVTGLMTAYVELPYLERTTAKLSFGRYLAQDVGTTIDLSKRFETGVVVGGFATFTNVRLRSTVRAVLPRVSILRFRLICCCRSRPRVPGRSAGYR
ncbi:MAG: YjbH domain-containing protein [Shewanella fodinae]|nr:YjbH domain-containing protein [Shewanella fodinae]